MSNVNLKTPDNLTLEPFYISLIKIPPAVPLVHFVQNYTVLLAHTLKRPHNKKNVARFRFTKIGSQSRMPAGVHACFLFFILKK